MSSLQTELNRLFRMQPGEGTLVVNGQVRALVLELARPADWPELSAVWRGVQADWQWPAPAIAVSGVDGYQLWFALAEPLAVADAHALLKALCVRYLSGVASARLRLFPSADGAEHAREVPSLQAQNGMWSAFVAPDLAAIFGDEPWLDVQPGAEAQATLLAQLQCIKPSAVQALLAHNQRAVVVPAVHAVSVAGTVSGPASELDPQTFLRAVMADPSVELRLRVDAAIALLPYGVDKGAGEGG